jgi:parvulin-like peptidyl-prolyl isomerase
VKKDLLSAVIVIVVIFAFTYGISAMHAPPPLQPTQPFTMDESAAAPAAAAEPKPAGRVILRVNGDEITEQEFTAAYATLPQEMQQQFNSEPGKQAFAEQLVRLKLLEQEARRLKLQQDPNVAGQLAASRTEILGSAALPKLVDKASPAAVQKFYNENQRQMQTVELSHIVVAYQGGMIPPKSGGAAPDQQTAMNKALQIYQRLKEGAKFDELARKESDDTASGIRGGLLGEVAPGRLPPELDARVMNLKEGEISTAIPSRYGVHIFKMGARHTQPLAAVQEQIAQKVRQDETLRRVEELRKAAKVDFDPQFFPDANKPPGSRLPRPTTTRPPA